jgi:membrane fusion protein (multidrug efflux system)
MNNCPVARIRAILLLAIIVMVTSCAEKKPQTPPPADITVVEVLQQDVPVYMEFVGQIYGIYDIPVRARVEGWLEELSFEEGGRVNKDQLLYTIDPAPYQTRVAEAKSRLASAKTDFANAESEYNRYKPLVEINAVSQSDYDAALANYDAARAAVEAAEANLRSAEIQLGYTRMFAPISGIIGKSHAQVGEFVGKDPNPVILNTVSRIDTMRVEFFLSESDYLRFTRYAQSQGRNVNEERKRTAQDPNLELILADGSIFEHKGWVRFVDRQVDPTTGSVLIQAYFPNPGRLLRPGQFARVNAVIERIEGAILVPQRCVSEIQGNYSIYKLNNDSTVSFQSVELGPRIGDMWVVLEGLDAGDEVVLEGIQYLRSGMTVNPVREEFESQSDIIKKN